MTKSELVERLSRKATYITSKDVENVVKTVLDSMSATLAAHRRIEIRGFGSFSLRYRKPRVGRNPKTGVKLTLEGKHVPHFKPGKEMRDRVNSRYLESLHQKQ